MTNFPTSERSAASSRAAVPGFRWGGLLVAYLTDGQLNPVATLRGIEAATPPA